MKKKQTKQICGVDVEFVELTDTQVHDFFSSLESQGMGNHPRDLYMQPQKVVPFSLVQECCPGTDLDAFIKYHSLTPSEVAEVYDHALEVNDFLSHGLGMVTVLGQATMDGLGEQ